MSKKTQYWLRIFLNAFVLILFLGIFSFGAWQMEQGFQDFFLGKIIQQQVFALDQEILLARPSFSSKNLGGLAKLSDVPKLEISSEAAICVEVNELGQEKILCKKNNDKKLSIASLTKLMTALVVLENYDLSQNVKISQEAVAREGEQGSLKALDALSIGNLLYIMLIESSNDAAYALAEIMGFDEFVETMNLKAKDLGLNNTFFVEPSGLDSKNYSTVDDLVKLTKYLLKNHSLIWEILSIEKATIFNSDGVLHHEALNTNELLGKIPGIIGGKTGYTKIANGCFILVLESPKKGNQLIYIILGSENRFEEMKKLIEWVNQTYQW